MNRIKCILPVIIFASTILQSCREKAIEIDSLEKEIFLRESREGIYKDGKPLFLYREAYDQKALNPKRIQYRIQTDEQDTCLNVALEALPGSPGVHITTSVDYRSPGELISNMSHLECSRIENNRIWLWNKDNLTGIIIDTDGM